MPETKRRHVGMIAVIGRANVGKSSLVNAVLGEKLSIVSPVAQTTRNAIRGILTDERGQLVFVDTPGIHKSQSNLGQVMNKMARASVEGCDLALLVLDAAETAREEDLGWISRLLREDIPVIAVLNKIDAVAGKPPADWPAIWKSVAAEKLAGQPDATEREKQNLTRQPEWFSVSAQTGDGLPRLIAHLFGRMPEGELLFPEDMLSDYPRKLAIADFIREKLFGVLREELPHAIAVWVDSLTENPDESWDIRAVVYVAKDSQKGIVLGEKGRLLRKIKRQSDAELSAIYERPVRVDLWVKVEKKWTDNFWLLKKFGYVP
jgi:GTP-binding protein Era